VRIRSQLKFVSTYQPSTSALLYRWAHDLGGHGRCNERLSSRRTGTCVHSRPI